MLEKKKVKKYYICPFYIFSCFLGSVKLCKMVCVQHLFPYFKSKFELYVCIKPR